MSDELDNIPIVEGVSFDPMPYRGFKISIEKVWVDTNAINWYNGPVNDNGQPTYNATSTETMHKVIIETYPLPKLDEKGEKTEDLVSFGTNEDGSPKPYRLTHRFNLTKKDGVWSISKAPSAKCWAFMRKMGAEKLSDLKNKIVILDIKADREDDTKHWLRINI